MAALNLVGGPAVLGSYVWGIASHENPGALWGTVPEAWQGLYTANMFVAAAGYLAFSAFLWFSVQPATAESLPGGFSWFNACYAAILVGATAWMPLGFYGLEHPSGGMELAIDGVLYLTALGSVGVVVGLSRLHPAPPRRRWAVLAAVLFCGQTVLLDALVWPQYFSL